MKPDDSDAKPAAIAGSALEPLLFDRQRQIYLSIAPMAAAGNIFNALIICAFAASVAPFRLLVPWFALIVAASLLRLISARSYRNPKRSADQPTLKSILLISGVLGAAWGGMIGWLLTLPDLSQLVPAMVGAGMMSAAASTLSVLPGAAFVFVTPIALGGLIGFAMAPSADSYAAIALLVSYSFVL